MKSTFDVGGVLSQGDKRVGTSVGLRPAALSNLQSEATGTGRSIVGWISRAAAQSNDRPHNDRRLHCSFAGRIAEAWNACWIAACGLIQPTKQMKQM